MWGETLMTFFPMSVGSTFQSTHPKWGETAIVHDIIYNVMNNMHNIPLYYILVMHIPVGLCVQIPIIFGATLPAFYVYFRFALKGSGFPLGYMSFFTPKCSIFVW